MERIYVESSNIRSIVYYKEEAILEIEFKNGYKYHYYDFPEYEFDAFMAAESKGKYAHQNIYKVYRQQRIS